IVLNTCVVRQSAEDRVYGRLSSLKPIKQRRPETILALMGCAVEEDTSSLQQRFPYVDLFVRPSDTESLIDFIASRDGPAAHQQPASSAVHPVSCYVPVMHGCDHLCTYCIVRLRRGRQRSKRPAEIVDEVQCLVGQGAREVTLLGQNVDAYGHDLPDQPTLAGLLETVHEIDGLWRIRFLTSHPADMTDELIEAVADLPKVCEHIEIPVQSGDDEILKRMLRRHTVTQYRELVAKIRERIPNVALVTDVIVGFPGESEKQFMNTYDLLREIRFDVVHVAAYSPRPGTAASRLPDDVPSQEKERRRKAVEELQKQIATEINARFLGQTVEVLVEEGHKGKWRGRTRTNKLVFFEDEGEWRGKLAQVQITWTGPWSMQGGNPTVLPSSPDSDKIKDQERAE
ncbi:MAG TPA: tRNA (N6-isopentenyl adenosine(37)-C2)-methylthiotransferase MiaB, partial [Anaerolineae bacterium]|nr:tRNA (N6-isopentenyl adenosine(37)-C2)-methylthiotransferase MiaB [Anaerolineae bacterium]